MSDVTRFDLVATMGGWTIGPDPTGRLVSLADYAKAEADHLAALERVRVETLGEARGAVGDRYDWQRNEFAPWGIKPLPDDQRFLDGIEDALAAIDRLIDATTTPLEES